MFRLRGKPLNTAEIERIVALLKDSELTLSEIAERMSCSRNTISVANRKFGVRNYGGRRSRWVATI